MATRQTTMRAVHPRLCGEHLQLQFVAAPLRGSSPPVRGTPHTLTRLSANRRFIPACAGNTLKHNWGRPWPPVHPRLCGEHHTSRHNCRSSYGSSPPVRGTPASHFLIFPVHRFIPACAGNTILSALPTRADTVHPRLCGEHGLRTGLMQPVDGSSPPVRGTRMIGLEPTLDERFIPACAGNTLPASVPIRAVPVHPRLCGEHHIPTRTDCALCGSSPPVRGTPPTCHILCKGRRFIPACAGNTDPYSGLMFELSVHPRLCGEHLWQQNRYKLRHGSSPPVRGTLNRPR